jgi:TPR repeat protein
VEQDYVEAAKWTQIAADRGDARAQFKLGYMYAEGQGVIETLARRRNGTAWPASKVKPSPSSTSA